MKKKLFLLIISLGAFLLLSGCVRGNATTTLEITSPSGEGTHTVSFTIPKDRDEYDGTSTNIYNNSSYFPKGYEEFARWVENELPNNGYSITVDEESDSENVHIDLSYSFSSFDEYVYKTKALIGERLWQEGKFSDPETYVTEIISGGESNLLSVTFAESSNIGSACISALLELAFSEDAVKAGVFLPYGDSFTNPHCIQRFLSQNPNGTEELFRDFADMEFLCSPDSSCETAGARKYIFLGETQNITSHKGMILTSAFIDDGSLKVTTKPFSEPTGISVIPSNEYYTLEDAPNIRYNVLTKYMPTETPALYPDDSFVSSKQEETSSETASAHISSSVSSDTSSLSPVMPSNEKEISVTAMVILIVALLLASLCVILAVLFYVKLERK